MSAQDIQIRYSARFDGDCIAVVLDSRAEDWHIDAAPGYSGTQMAALLDRVYGMGYEPLPEEECEAEILPDGGVRIYLVPVGV